MSRTTGLGPAALVAALIAAAAVAVPGSAAASTDDTPGNAQGWTRGVVVPANLTPPAAFAPIGVVDDPVDGADVPDVAQARILASSPGKAPGSTHETAHGTEVASVAAAKADGAGVIGIAPGAPLLSYGYKEGTGEPPTCQEVADGIVALADAHAKVINLSVETDADCEELRLAIGAAYGDGVLIVGAAGNAGDNPQFPHTYPADDPHVLTVGAVAIGLAPSSFSTPSSGVDLVAPGEAVPVAVPPALDGDGTRDGLSIEDGTSFASPIVAGLASWLIAARPGLAPSQYADLLRATAKSAGAWSAKSGFGLPDLAGALTAPIPAADRYEPNDAIDQVDGMAYSGADPYRSGTLKATISPVEDPADVYRIRVKARGRATATLTGGGGAKLYVYAGTAKAFNNNAIGKMKVSVHNTTKKAKTYYVAVREPATAKRAAVSSAYTLKLAKR